MMFSKFMKRLALAVVAGHAAIATGLHFYGKQKTTPKTDRNSKFNQLFKVLEKKK